MGMPILPLTSELALHTRRGNQIVNEINREPLRYGDQLRAEDLEREYGFPCVHRPVNPSRKYNCHGLTFASRRTWIDSAEEVHKIIREDEYEEINPVARVMPGDVAVYYGEGGDVEHSGVVIRLDALNVPIILSKWGACHEIIHPVGRSEYDASNVKYYRITT